MRNCNNQTSVTIFDFILILILCWGWPVIRSTGVVFGLFQPPELTDLKLMVLICAEVASGLLALFLLGRKGWKFHPNQIEISWSTTGAGLLLLLLSYFAYIIAYTLGLFIGGDDSKLREFAKSNSTSASIAILASLVNGTFEEILQVGFVFKALERQPLPFIIGISVLLRVAAHTYQGPVGALGILAMGIVFSLVYARYHKIWPLILAHIITDLLALLQKHT